MKIERERSQHYIQCLPMVNICETDKLVNRSKTSHKLDSELKLSTESYSINLWENFHLTIRYIYKVITQQNRNSTVLSIVSLRHWYPEDGFIVWSQMIWMEIQMNWIEIQDTGKWIESSWFSKLFIFLNC